LEYLENVLPESVRAGLWPHLGESQFVSRRRRDTKESIAELKRIAAKTNAGN